MLPPVLTMTYGRRIAMQLRAAAAAGAGYQQALLPFQRARRGALTRPLEATLGLQAEIAAIPPRRPRFPAEISNAVVGGDGAHSRRQDDDPDSLRARAFWRGRWRTTVHALWQRAVSGRGPLGGNMDIPCVRIAIICSPSRARKRVHRRALPRTPQGARTARVGVRWFFGGLCAAVRGRCRTRRATLF